MIPTCAAARVAAYAARQLFSDPGNVCDLVIG
jgi:hypothetical protein